MKILKEVFIKMNNSISGEPPEIGGILGNKGNGIISHFIMDNVTERPIKMCSYSPDVDFLNECIDGWQKDGIKFSGIFHTHFAGVKTLSKSDKEYILRIMQAMPDEIISLYFPVFVLPDRELVCYRANKENTGVTINAEDIELI